MYICLLRRSPSSKQQPYDIQMFTSSCMMKRLDIQQIKTIHITKHVIKIGIQETWVRVQARLPNLLQHQWYSAFAQQSQGNQQSWLYTEQCQHILHICLMWGTKRGKKKKHIELSLFTMQPIDGYQCWIPWPKRSESLLDHGPKPHIMWYLPPAQASWRGIAPSSSLDSKLAPRCNSSWQEDLAYVTVMINQEANKNWEPIKH